MKSYKLGNLLRGGFERRFKSIDEAWKFLGSRFLLSYPCEKVDDGELVENIDSGRHVQMYVLEENKYGIKEYVMCKSDIFNMTERADVSSMKFKQLSGVEFWG